MDTDVKWNICRTCLCDDVELQPIFNNFNNSQLVVNNTPVSLPEMIISCTALQVSPSDTYPQQICSECVEQLLSAFYFKTKCISSAKTLKQIQLKENSEDSSLKNWQQIDIKTELDMLTEPRDETTVVLGGVEAILEDSMAKLDPVSLENAKSMKENNMRIGKKITKKKSAKPKTADGRKKLALKKKTNGVKETLLKDVEMEDARLNEIFKDTGTEELRKKKHVCPECGKRFDSQKNLERHRSSMAHHRNQPGKSIKTCYRCKIYFEDVLAYREHVKSHKIYLCADCGRVCKGKSGYVAHQASHSTLQPHECTECGKKYKSISALQVHQRNHTGERRYECEQCGKKFVTWSTLNYHTRTQHSKELNHVCKVCGKAFFAKGSLNIHMRQHTGEKPYPCSECDMTFRSYNDRKCHMVKHTGERRYPCPVCSKRFSRPYNVTQHMVTHTGQRKHVCATCGRAFTQAHVLRGHLRTHPEHLPQQQQQQQQVVQELLVA